ncbi:MAG: TIGR03619 family F420-dependent LLM class oxidoreductase [Actinobacteria bacterium]|nr:TIGR03619 family F420-dependent LLM class oxidoreductase [Actinomycetota bacterium]
MSLAESEKKAGGLMTTSYTAPKQVVSRLSDQVVWGMQLPIQSQSSLYVQPWELTASVDDLAAIAVAADQVGCYYLGVCDHTAIPGRLVSAMGSTWYDTTATLGWLAAITKQTHLLSHVLILAQRHPLRAAKELSTIDHLSGGRLIVGVGAGHVQEEYDLLKGDFAERGRHLDEAISALAACFEEEAPSLPGPAFPASDLHLSPRPVSSPRPPIWVGGSSGPALKRTALFGDGWLPQGTKRADLAGQIGYIRELRAEHRGGAPLDIGTIAEPVHTLSAPGASPSIDPSKYFLMGSAEEVAVSLRELVALGVNHLQIPFRASSVGDYLEQVQRFGEEVFPLVLS